MMPRSLAGLPGAALALFVALSSLPLPSHASLVCAPSGQKTVLRLQFANQPAVARDLQALEVHGDFLTSRVAMASDVTLGMVNLAQNKTVKIVSVVAAIFLPPTLIASAYGMNFAYMPELAWGWGYPMAVGLMVASAVLTYLFFKWKRWL